MLAHISELAPECPLTDVTSVKSAVLDEVAAAGLQERFVGGHPMTGTADSGWAAGYAGLFTGAPWVVSVDDHVDPDGVVDGDDVGAGLRRAGGAGQIRRARRRRGGHLTSAASARRGAGSHRRRGPAGLRAGRRIVPRRHPGGGHRPAPGAGDVRRQLRAAAAGRSTGSSSC